MTPRKKIDLEQQNLLQARVTTAPCCPPLKRAVTEWRADGYKGTTATTRTLLRHWFETDHRMRDGSRFSWHYFQREAIETLIYAFEIAKVRRHRDLLQTYAPNIAGIRLLQHDEFARYAIKMATGSGKTKTMSLAIAWQYFNAVAEGDEDYARTFLIIAPNVIVFERLRSDFEGGRIFITDPIIPAELRLYWDMDFYMRGDPERVSSQGAVYLSNVQQLYDPRPVADPEPEPLAAVLGPRAPATLTETTPFRERIQSRSAPVMVINDEGHHTHDEENEWNKVIRSIHANTANGLSAQVDFSATPRYAEGGLFTWTIYDYPLKQAIIDNVVKRPMKGVAKGIREQPSDVASVRYRAYLTAGVERWKEYCEQLAPLGKRPLLFVMMNSTAEADDVADYLRHKYPEEFGGEDRCLVIHTDRSGEISKKDVEKAREVSRRVDEGTSPVNAIVSVLMLREGWDVQSVTVIVGLRPYTAKANILPEQTIGRGLRLMFRNFGGSYIERVDVIGNDAFLKFVEQLEKEEDIALETSDLSKKLVIVSIWIDENKLEHDIVIPTLSPVLARKKTLAEEIAGLDIDAMKTPALPKKPGDAAAQNFQYEGYDIITLQKEVEREYTIPEPSTAEEVISYYAKRISQEVKLPSQFASLVPKVREFLERKAFGEVVDLKETSIIKAMASPVAQYVIVKTFKDALRGLVIEEHSPSLVSEGRKLSETPAFPYSRPTLPARKTVFNLVAADNEFERDFARFLENASDVRSFAKLPSQFGFAIEYVDAAGNLRYYEPDFVAVDFDDVHHLIETKGREDIDVQHKDRAAKIWCENATMLTETRWIYIKVPQPEWVKLQPSELAELRLVFASDLDRVESAVGPARAAEDAADYDA